MDGHLQDNGPLQSDEDSIMVIDPDLAYRIELNNCEIDY